MLTKKSKGLFFEVSEFSVLAAITSSLDAPFTVESIQESPHDDNADKVRGFVAGLSDDKSRGYIHGHCGIYPKSRFVRRTTLDSPNKAKEPNYFTDLLNDQFRIDPSKYLTTIVNAYDGTDFDLEKGVQNQKELDLKDEESAKIFFYSDTFDFTEMGPALLNKMVKELQSSTGFYEVQTGQTIGQIFVTLIPKNLNWIHQTLSRSLGVEVLHLDYPSWMQSQNISVSEDVQLERLDSRWLSIFSLMGNYSNSEDGAN